MLNESEGLQRVQRTDTISGESVLLIIRVMHVVSRHQPGYIITELGRNCAAVLNPEKNDSALTIWIWFNYAEFVMAFYFSTTYRSVAKLFGH